MVFPACSWLNEPARWRFEGEQLQVVTDARTDFWRETHYGFTRDSGHFLGHRIAGPFTAQLRIKAQYEALYDQAGMMVRLDEARWIKAGIEWSDNAPRLGSVLTLGSSDWATGPFHGDAADFWLRVTVSAGVIRVQVSDDGQRWPLLRLAPFPDIPFYHVGPMCCTPERAGLTAEFSEFTVGPALDRALHDLS
jgi:regulation of enolase protein 1 (concanavalin A-like superfamily)